MIRRIWSTLALVAAFLAVGGTAMAARVTVNPADVPGIRPGAATIAAGLVITTVDPAGQAVTAACFELWTDAGAGARGALVAGTRRCDQPADPTGKIGPQDGLRDGALGWTGLAPGAYVVVETLPPALAGTAATYELAADARVTVSSGEVARLTLVHRPTAGLTLRKLDPAGRPLAGACFSLATGGRVIVARCDGTAPAGLATPAGDGLADGLLVFTALAPTNKPTTYTLHEIHPPDGYAAVADQTVTVSPTEPTELTITDTTGGGAGLVITTVDPAGQAVTAACFELWTDAGAGARGALVAGTRRCDQPADPTGKIGPQDGLRDGALGWTGLAPGAYVVVETLPPALAGTAATYELAADARVTVSSGEVARLTLVHRPTAGLTLRKLDPAGRPLAGACFSLATGGRVIVARCDGTAPAGLATPAGDGLADGLLVFTALAPTNKPTTYTLHEIHPPDGYAAVADQTVTVSPTEPTELTITDTTGGGAGLVITTVDPAGQAVTAACFELWTDAGAGARGALVAGTRRCDQPADPTGKIGPQDGLRDGALGWTGLAPGAYVVVETLPPALAGTAATYELAADARVTVSSGEVARLTLVHRPTAGLTLRKLDPAGRPLAGACFSLATGGRVIVARCDGTAPAGLATPAGDGLADGLLVFTALAPTNKPTTYTLHEIHPPDGYAAVADQTVTVSPTEPTELTITDTTGGGGGVPIIGLELELEIESTITIEKLTAMPVLNGVTTATGRIPLEGDVDSGNWHGSGELTSATSVAAGACPSMEVTGSGTYDWVVRSATASPDLEAGDLVVNMDSGPIVEAPDTFTMDTCSEPINGTLNTWENLFFDSYRSRFGAAGFRVDGWALVGGAEAWASGGVIAEAHWTGTCGTTLVLGCSDETTFRLLAVVTGTGPAGSIEPSPGGGGTGATATPVGGESIGPGSPTESPGIVPVSPGAFACADLAGCLTSGPALAILGGLVIAAVIGGAALLRSRAFERNQKVLPLKVTPPTLNGTAGDDPAIAELSVDESGALDFDKVGPLAFEKLPPDGGPSAFDKLPPDGGPSDPGAPSTTPSDYGKLPVDPRPGPSLPDGPP